jgi:DNA gyrase subunit B
VYIACPPLYKVKSGSEERYIEKEQDLEDWLLERNLASISVEGSDEGFSRERFQRYLRTLREHDGWSAALRGNHGGHVVDFLQAHSLIEVEPVGLDDLAAKIVAASSDLSSLTAEIIDAEAGLISARSQLIRTSESRRVTVPLSIFESRELAGLRDLVGDPPFRLKRGSGSRVATSYDGLRHAVMELCRDRVQLNRFKGLGEMNADQLWETTMDPSVRILQQVTLEDAAAAEELFSMLMGDKVEPRREFIEQNARSVRFLDV